MRLLIQLVEELRSRLQYKIIIPFLVLTLIVAVVGAAMSFSLVTGSWQERFDNQLAQVARDASDSLVDEERANLVLLQEMALAQRNEAADAPAVNVALANQDAVGLAKALDPFFQIAPQRGSVHLDRLIAFDKSGHAVLDWERSAENQNTHITHDLLDLSQIWFVPKVLASNVDDQGDKFASLLSLPDTNALYVATIAPVKQGDQVVGGLIVAMRVETLLTQLRDRSQAAIVTIYDGNGRALDSTTRPIAGLGSLSIGQEGLEQLRTTDSGENGAVYKVNVNEREYQFAYIPLQIRDATVGILSVALSRDYVTAALSSARTPLLVLTVIAIAAIGYLGAFIARRITAPLKELATTASAVTAGELDRRGIVNSRDEVGLLAESINSMTEHLLQLYSERAAIVESIVDGIVVCDNNGKILSVNQAMRHFLGLDNDAPLPERFCDLPLEPLPDNPDSSDRHVSNLFMLNDRIVRARASSIPASDDSRLGIVCVLQDMTAEVAIDRAKTNFIATISHELRTPLTVLRGNADLLLRGMMGPLDPEQRGLIETMRNHAANMTALVSNVIAIAGLDSGSIVPEPVPTNLRQAIEEFIWPMRSQITAKGLELRMEISTDLPLVMVDSIHLRTVLTQLLDNARRYTKEGTVTVRTINLGNEVRVDVIDTGRGIPESLHDNLFDRFIRGDGTNDGINSAERGIGLGLAIAKQLLERQGGRIWLATTSADGSTFSFTLTHAHDTPQLDSPSQAAA